MFLSHVDASLSLKLLSLKSMNISSGEGFLKKRKKYIISRIKKILLDSDAFLENPGNKVLLQTS